MAEELNLETMPLNELRALALAEDKKTKDQAPPEKEKAAAVPLPNQDDELVNAPAEEEPEPEEYIYKKEIDLEDGSGVQVFSGKGATKEAALEELAEKLAVAQRNASKKIRELNSQVHAQPKEREFSADEEYVYSQQLQQKPTEGFKVLFKEVTGMDVSEFKTNSEALKEFSRVQKSLAVQTEFVASHPDYEANTGNATKIQNWVKDHNFTDYTNSNLEQAYQDLKKSGLLTLKTSETDAGTDEEVKATPRIVETKTEATQQRSQRRSSTVSGRGGAPAVKTEPTEDELYSMPLDKLRQLANAKA